MPTREFMNTYGARREAERRAAEEYRRHRGIVRPNTRGEAELLDLSLGILWDDPELYDALRPALELIYHRMNRRWRHDA